MIDKELWQRWENHAKSMMTIPKLPRKYGMQQRNFIHKILLVLWKGYNYYVYKAKYKINNYSYLL